MRVLRNCVLAALLVVPPAGAGAWAGEAGIGRLNHAGYRERQHCTAFLTAGGHLVTAGHCLDLPAGARLHFLEGYDRGGWTRHLEVPAEAFAVDAARDLAVACGLAKAGGTGLALSEAGLRDGDAAEARGYGRPRKHVLQPVACTAAGRAGPAYVLDCTVSKGISGGPVVRGHGRDARVVGVVTSGDARRTLAARLTPKLIAETCGR